MNLKYEPLSPHLGVELKDVVLSELYPSDEFYWRLRQILADHLVVLIRHQELSAEQLEGLAGRFGPLMNSRTPSVEAHHVGGSIKVISNGTDSNGRRFGNGNASAQVWHTDSSAPWEVPSGHVFLYCKKAPRNPPRTFFMDMRKVYASLPSELKSKISKLRVIHHHYPREHEVTISEAGPSYPIEIRKIGPVHPLVRRHLSTQVPMLYLPTRRDSLVVGLTEGESRALLTELWRYVEEAPYRCAAALEPNDLVLWDNGACVHSREGWSEDEVRVLWHQSAAGEIPVPYSPETGTRNESLLPPLS